MQEFILISVFWMLDQRVSTYDAQCAEIADTGESQRHGAEVVFVFAEFMKAKGLLQSDVEVA